MKITLLDSTTMESLALATAQPYGAKPTNKLVKKVFNEGHRSISRHSIITFLIEDVSQSLLRQISRHPHVNLTVESSRYKDMGLKVCVIPPFVKKEHIQEYMSDYNEVMNIYNKWNKKEEYNEKEQKEISKMFLPLCSTVNLVISGNYQAIYEFLELRNCVRSEWEIMKLSHEMTKMCKEVSPELFDKLGCKGDFQGWCNEEKSHGACGKYLKREDLEKLIQIGLREQKALNFKDNI